MATQLNTATLCTMSKTTTTTLTNTSSKRPFFQTNLGCRRCLVVAHGLFLKDKNLVGELIQVFYR